MGRAESYRRIRPGVQPIFRVLTEHGTPIAPSAYYEAKDQSLARGDLPRLWARQVWFYLRQEG